ncbi:MAG: glycosyltransferase family 39 protein [Solirubrobacterales bacterium]
MNLSALLHHPAATEPSSGSFRSRGSAAAEPRRRTDARWVRPAFFALLILTAIAYIWGLGANGDSNSFYAAAVEAGTKSWKAFFFGSIDSSNFITVDKPPASLWVMELSGKLFGFSTWSMLVPQALEGVAAVGLLYAGVKRWFGAPAGLIAGALLAITPVAALMFRFNNPDALLVCLLVASAYCLVRALEKAGTKWVLAAGALIGFAFLAKMMQAFLVLPAFGLVYLVAAPTGLRRRLLQLLAGGAAIVASAGWWVAIVALWPAGSRPMIDGSASNSILDLIVGYNGLGRIFGGGAGGGGGGNFSGEPGILRLFNESMGAQASWLLPAALLAVVVGLWTTRRAPRTDRTRAALLLWGGWLVVTALVFSLGSGIIHTYYTVALAPAIAAPIAIVATRLWAARESLAARAALSLGVLVTAGWAYELLDRTPDWNPWLRPLVIACSALGVAGLLALPRLRGLGRSARIGVAILCAVACLAGPVAYTAQTISTAHTGTTPTAGPGSSGMGGMGGGAPGGGEPPSGGGAPGGSEGSGPGSAEGSGPGASESSSSSSSSSSTSTSSTSTETKVSELFESSGESGETGGESSGGSSGAPSGGSGGPGGGGGSVETALVEALESEAGSYRWVAATSGSENAAELELATEGEPVMAIGGFNGQGGNLSLAKFKEYVAEGAIHYYVASSGGGGGGMGGPGGSSSIASWVEAHFEATEIGGRTVYDLTSSTE